MGDWTLIVSGTGVHHNNNPEGHYGANGCEEDADQRLLEFVDQLARDGHDIKNAAIVHGGGADVVQLGYPEGAVGLRVVRYSRANGVTEDAQSRLAARRVRRQATQAAQS